MTNLTEKIIEAVPEIMELKFGCEVIVETSKAGLQQTVITGWMSDGKYMTWSFGEKAEKDIKKILGRPITLEDVLRAIEKNPPIEPFFVSITGHFHKQFENGDMSSTLAKWQLGKPLSEQSPETLQFLERILV